MRKGPADRIRAFYEFGPLRVVAVVLAKTIRTPERPSTFFNGDKDFGTFEYPFERTPGSNSHDLGVGLRLSGIQTDRGGPDLLLP
jgi:hypothetical protein